MNVSGCKLNYDVNDAVENGMVITVEASLTVTVLADGNTYELNTAGGTVADVISLAGITLGDADYCEPSVDTAVESGMEITVCRTVVKTETVSETIKYSTETKNDDSMTVGETKVETAGQNGEKKVTYQVTYVNGEETSRLELTSVTVKEPVTEVKYVGTAAAGFEPNGVQSKNGYSVGQTVSGKYTHYCPCAKCCGKNTGNTASGKKVYVGMPEPYYVACNWLPLGSVIDVDGQTYTVVDRGGSGLSKAGRIDIFTPGGHSAALSAGTGRCTITILRLGW